ncbi:PF08643 family protein [Leptospira fainei serovar Hurstbridge str. BUT 6]|uniref:PF08643 family protein n=1 Tax=Leptospira fainei serovar Hurstbridge str. BUT 6 TaxID=1193011 RepID=S3URZ0_9LEPT|nr:SDR family NAD(P)-dependent oxidoreductase [Leptospira fainei]EPG73181.1 PF08643 family protein [Leptospira fainei serovar Hurstbridge str. BUT 6]
MNSILVTGVSSGIGLALTEKLIKNGSFVFGSVRSKDQGLTLKNRLGERFYPLYFDVTDETAISEAEIEVKSVLGSKNLNGLVNNAGVVIPGPLKEMPISAFRKQLDINLIGPFAVIQKFLPLLGARPDNMELPGRVVNISSMSGVRTFPFLGAYSVSKYGIEALTDGLRRELGLYGIDVISILPGAILTPMTDKINNDLRTSLAFSDYQNSLLKFMKLNESNAHRGIPLSRVVDTIIIALETKRPKVRYFLKSSFIVDTLLSKYLPTRIFDKLIAITFGIRKRKS